MTGQSGVAYSPRFFAGSWKVMRRRRTGWPLLLACALVAATPLEAQAPAEDETSLRNRALELIKQGNQTDALPLLEKVAAARPTDIVVLEKLGGVLAGTAGQINDPEARKQTVLRARGILLHAKELGDNSNYLTVLLEKLPADGELTGSSGRHDVDDALREGEAAFAKSDYSTALAAYQRVAQLDPTNYDAPLFSGDVYFRMNQMDKAGECFAKAIAIAPNRETAYRYWGDALMKQGKTEEAKAKFMDAIVAEPYQQTSWVGLKQWAKATHATLEQPKIEVPVSVSAEGDGKININIDPKSLDKKNGDYVWMTYGGTRALWHSEKFKKEFPDETTYRHTLAEEVDALQSVAGSVMPARNEKKHYKLDPALLTLVELRDQGLLEPYVLFARPDEGIAKDYPAYRDAHPDKLRLYLLNWVISTTEGNQ